MVNTMSCYRAVLEEWNAVPGNKPVLMVPGGPALVRLEKEITAKAFPRATDFQIGCVFIGLTRSHSKASHAASRHPPNAPRLPAALDSESSGFRCPLHGVSRDHRPTAGKFGFTTTMFRRSSSASHDVIPSM